jgi:hypothetical protein
VGYTENPTPNPEPTPTPEPTPIPEIDPPKIDPGSGSVSDVVNGIIDVIVGFFKELGKNGLKIMTVAVALGIIFIGGKWLWLKVRQWLNQV